VRAAYRVYSLVLVLAALLALGIHFALTVASQADPLLGTLRFFSYFTIISNTAVALTLGVPLLGPSRPGRFFSTPRVRAAVALYITVTGVVYALLLAHLWQPEGARWFANALLHYVVPSAYVIGWIVFTPHARLTWGDALRFLAVPAAYLAWTLVRGAWLGEWPYPFLNVDELGAAGFARSAGGLAVFFAVLGLVVVALDKGLGRFTPARD
jgi:hypothetical protein